MLEEQSELQEEEQDEVQSLEQLEQLEQLWHFFLNHFFAKKCFFALWQETVQLLLQLLHSTTTAEEQLLTQELQPCPPTVLIATNKTVLNMGQKPFLSLA